MATHVLLAGVIAGTVAAGAAGATPKADKHDRAALKQLIAQQLVMPTKADAALLAIASKCGAWKNPVIDRRELAASLVTPAEYRFRDAHASAYAAYRAALASVHPHALVFRKWVPKARYRMTLTLRYWREFDSSRLDVCSYLDEVAASGGDWDSAEMQMLKSDPRNLSAYNRYWNAMVATDGPERSRFEAFLQASGFKWEQVDALVTYH